MGGGLFCHDFNVGTTFGTQLTPMGVIFQDFIFPAMKKKVGHFRFKNFAPSVFRVRFHGENEDAVADRAYEKVGKNLINILI